MSLSASGDPLDAIGGWLGDPFSYDGSVHVVMDHVLHSGRLIRLS
jgi:hypothetical protein